MLETSKFTPEEDVDPADFRGQVYDEKAEYEDELQLHNKAAEIIKMTLPGFVRDYDISVRDIYLGDKLPAFPIVVLMRKDDHRKIYPIAFFERDLNPASIKRVLENNIRSRDKWDYEELS